MLARQENQDDIYLSPHHDDICFSLGSFVHERHSGTLLNVFSVSDYRADRPSRDASKRCETSRKRLTEDVDFAFECGLRFLNLEFNDASARGQPPFDVLRSAEISEAIEQRLMLALAGQRIGRLPNPKPWLFCPSGIGGHVDHVAVLLTIVKNLPQLQEQFKVAFYEDLHYASDRLRRQNGLTVLNQLLAPTNRKFERLWFKLDERAQADKMRLVRGYDSQLTAEIDTISAYTPAVADHSLPHEALWIIHDDDMHQSSG